MGGVDLCDQMTIVDKSKKQQRWYLTLVPQVVMLAIHNSYILEGFQIDHTVAGRRKRDILQYKQELYIQLVGNYPQTCLQASADAKRRRSGEACPEQLLNVGLHLPIRGGDKPLVCGVWEEVQGGQEDWSKHFCEAP